MHLTAYATDIPMTAKCKYKLLKKGDRQIQVFMKAHKPFHIY